MGPLVMALGCRTGRVAGPGGAVRFGLIADIHPDVLPDGRARVQAFVAAMEAAQVDFILHLGDFCSPEPGYWRYLQAWNEFRGPRYSVLGNHDMDGGHLREVAAGFYGMPGPHYTFEAGPMRGIVLDGNESGGRARGTKRYLGPEQLEWLRVQLATGDRPAALFIHQPFDADHSMCLENSAAVRAVVEDAQRARTGSVVAVFGGHQHLDYVTLVNGVRYIHINSAAYWWLDDPTAARETYPHEVHRVYRHLKSVAPYRDPLWALVTVDFGRSEIRLEGRRSEWVGPNPWARGEREAWPAEHLHPAILDRQLRLRG
jgi:predicted phosphodiesterase